MQFFSSSPEALEAFRLQPCSVLVSDLSMPDLTGLQLAHEAKQLFPAVQVIILTGTANLQSAIQAINESEIFRFYTKPCTPEELAAGIEAAIPECDARVKVQDRVSPPTSRIGEAALSKIPLGVVVTDRMAHIEFMNQRATEIIARNDGLLVGGDGVLRASSSGDSNLLHECITRIYDADGDEANGGLSIDRPSMQRPISVLVTLMDDSTDNARAVLFLTDPDVPLNVSARVIADLFGLTDSESRLVQALAEGRRLDEAATAAGLTLSSARTYLKQIFSKTETCRQAELVQLVLTSPAILDSQIPPAVPG